ncbi:hypothetical protein C8Q74DRAFT_1383169 [Fomes fomentarius]|nr:hypothetical protein C8Q74DRAFT_1383169 [Fomes fomentarius]
MDASRKKAERLCELILSDASDPLPNGLRFNICLTDDSDSIRLSAFHDLASLPMFLAASARVQQFAKAGPLEDKDADAVKQLGTYMKNRSLFCFARLSHDALLIVYPTDHELSTKVLQVPQTLAKDTPLQVALVPWELTSGAFHSADWKPYEPTVKRSLDSQLIPVLDAAGKEVITQRRFYQAIHILGISREVFDYVSQIPRTYCLWTGPADAANTGPGYETLLLKDFLSACKWTDLGLYSNARLVLVHVGGLASLHLLPGLAERRLQVGLRFMTYGTHPSVPHAQWGVREIYPLGGIVTFTPNAIIENHFRLFSLIRKIADHPTWECYVLPSVVAMVAKLTCQGQNPLRVYDEGQFVYEDLLRLIEEGTIALLQAPQATRTSLSKGDPALLWTRWMLRLPAMNARQILEECITVAAEEFANASDADIGRAIEKEIARDLRRMHIQPAIMDSFRRFVAIKTKSDLNLQQDLKGFECHTLSNFEFKDDYYSPVDGKKLESDRKK